MELTSPNLGSLILYFVIGFVVFLLSLWLCSSIFQGDKVVITCIMLCILAYTGLLLYFTNNLLIALAGMMGAILPILFLLSILVDTKTTSRSG